MLASDSQLSVISVHRAETILVESLEQGTIWVFFFLFQVFIDL